MGTRNLTMVVSEGQTRIAQYGQWDGYPEGQGRTALIFLLNNDLNVFKEKLRKVRFIDEAKAQEIEKFAKKLGSEGGWMAIDQAAKFDKKYPLLSRDVAAKILQEVYDSKEDEIWLNDESAFAGDSLFCEWAYVIDLDKGTFEVYQGFNQEPLTEDERFYGVATDERNKEYYPIKLLISFDLSNLPQYDEFIGAIKEKLPVEDEE